MKLTPKQLEVLLEAQQRIISIIALSNDLGSSLREICLSIEETLNSAHARASILLLKGNQLRHGAAPGLSEQYCQAIDGVTIGASVGSCGTAAFTGRQIIVEDINTDPLWADYKSYALAEGLQACWSTPIIDSHEQIIGTFAIYYTKPKAPEPFHLELIRLYTHLSSLAIQHLETQQQLQQSINKLSAFTSVMPDLAIVINEEGYYVDIYGGDKSIALNNGVDIIGRHIGEVLPPELLHDAYQTIAKTLVSNSVQRMEYSLKVPKGELTFEGHIAPINHYLPDSPEQRHVVWMARDITLRKNAERKIENLAFYDPLTNLPNRRMLTQHLDHELASIKRNQNTAALLFLDLNDFKRINDSHGHTAGDRLLGQVADRLKPVIRQTDTLARLGGDEFVLLLSHNGPAKAVNEIAEDAAMVARKIIKTLTGAFNIANYEYQIGVSIGISLISPDDESSDAVLKRADAAMYHAKKDVGSSYYFFNRELQQHLDTLIGLEQDLIRAINQQQLTAYFQPQVDREGKLLGVEALVRWQHPEKGFIAPDVFIPIAENCGLISAIQSVVIHESCTLLNTLAAELPAGFRVAINISADQFKRDELKQQLEDILQQHNISPTKIKLELTESMLLNDIESAITKMKLLKTMGFSISIDDFGTGYSSLAYLHALPIDELKIDKSFIQNITSIDAPSPITDAIIGLSKQFKLAVVAEGVETELHAQVLRTKAIDSMQGYLFAKPMPLPEFCGWLNQPQNE